MQIYALQNSSDNKSMKGTSIGMKTRLKDLREDNDFTQAQIAKQLNISQVAYSYYELGRRSIPIEVLSTLADYYNTSVDYLIYRTSNYTPYPKDKK